MADTLKNLAHGTLGDFDTVKYGVPPNTTTILKEIILTNNQSNDQTVTVKINDGASVDTVIISNKIIPANETYVIELHSILQTNYLLKGSCSIANGVSFYASGIEVV